MSEPTRVSPVYGGRVSHARRSAQGRGVVAALSVAAFLWLPGTGVNGGDAALDAITARHETIQNIEVEYTKAEHFLPQGPVKIDFDVSQWRAQVTPKFGSGRFRFLSGLAYYEWRVDTNKQERLKAGETEYFVSVFTRDRVERSYKGASKHDFGRIASRTVDAERLPFDSVVDIGLGLRAEEDQEWLVAESWEHFAMNHNSDGTVSLRRSAHLPEPNVDRDDLWTFDPKLGYALVRWEKFWNGARSDLLENAEFRQVEQLMLPVQMTLREWQTETGTLVRRREIAVTSYTLNDANNLPERFRVRWPDGAVVQDNRTGTRLVVANGPRVLDDAALAELAAGRTGLERGTPSAGRLWTIVGVNVLLLAAGAVAWTLRRRRMVLRG